jgi:hypothetical protein
VIHTPDFFVLRSAAAGWEECKNRRIYMNISARAAARPRQAPSFGSIDVIGECLLPKIQVVRDDAARLGLDDKPVTGMQSCHPS